MKTLIEYLNDHNAIKEDLAYYLKKRCIAMSTLADEIGIGRQRLDRYFKGNIDIKTKTVIKIYNWIEKQQIECASK